jgi:hypothetical protein
MCLLVRRHDVEVGRKASAAVVADGVLGHGSHRVALAGGHGQPQARERQQVLKLLERGVAATGLPPRDGRLRDAESHREVTLAEVGHPARAQHHARYLEGAVADRVAVSHDPSVAQTPDGRRASSTGSKSA